MKSRIYPLDDNPALVQRVHSRRKDGQKFEEIVKGVARGPISN